MTTTEMPLTKVAVGLDYESDSPWVWTGDKVEEDAEDVTGWFVVEVPTEMADRFKTAQAELEAALTAIHDHVGFDAQWSRLREQCGAYVGDVLTINGRDFWDDCKRCGWKRDEHTEATS